MRSNLKIRMCVTQKYTLNRFKCKYLYNYPVQCSSKIFLSHWINWLVELCSMVFVFVCWVNDGNLNSHVLHKYIWKACKVWTWSVCISERKIETNWGENLSKNVNINTWKEFQSSNVIKWQQDITINSVHIVLY